MPSSQLQASGSGHAYMPVAVQLLQVGTGLQLQQQPAAAGTFNGVHATANTSSQQQQPVVHVSASAL
jgi:hypothetical protein